MKKFLILLIISVLALLVLVSCGNSKNPYSNAQTEKENININDLVTIKEVVNKEGVAPNGEKVRYIYEVPIINIDKPGAQKINDTLLHLEKEQEDRINNGQNMTLFIKSKAFLYDGIIAVVMEIKKPGPGGLNVANYEIENDKELSTKELLEKYKFDPHKLIAEINRQTKINESKPVEERDFINIDDFVYTILFSSNDNQKKLEDINSITKEEKEKYVIENIDKIKAYINNDGTFVFIYSAELEDKELVVE